MKKIIITETQLKKITKLLISEQKMTNIEGRKTTINPDGTLSILDKLGRAVKIRLKTGRKIMGNDLVNIVKFFRKEDGDYEIETLKGTNKTFELDKVKQLINFVDSSDMESNPLDSSMITGPLKAFKV